jgi:hypothetical protein
MTSKASRSLASALCLLLIAAGVSATAAAGNSRSVDIEQMVAVGQKAVTHFFGSPFLEPVRLKVAPDRARFDAALPSDWGMPSSECWMVGVGVADFLLILSPKVWATQACEHDPNNLAATQRLVTHELTHVFHGQRNPTRDFDGADDIGWFIEGLGVLVSGQLDQEHQSDATEAIKAGRAPAR